MIGEVVLGKAALATSGERKVLGCCPLVRAPGVTMNIHEMDAVNY